MMQPAPHSQERRLGEPPVPEHLNRYLSVEQLRALHQVENFGWSLAFVRRPLFQTPIAVLVSANHQDYALLTEEGEIERNPDLLIRP